jgi:hypothetical protein
MTKRFAFVVISTIGILHGCVTAPQAPIEYSQDALSAKSGRVGVAMSTLPKVDTEFPGASCLLCYAAAAAANSSLTSYAHTLPYEDLPKLKNDMADALRKKGVDAIVIADPVDVEALSKNENAGPNLARKDFSPLKSKYMVDKLLMIQITNMGFIRTYSAYVPTSEPKAELHGTGYLVNLKNNAYEWYMPVNVSKAADKNWDEPPQFPGLTNAYYQMLEVSKDSYMKPFKN